MDDRRPNILMIMADQFRLTTLDGMGDRIPTPNIRRIMDRGVVFTQASCTSPLCTPSRASLATGRYPSRCGVPVHDMVLPPEQTTYYQLLRQAGYRVGVAGKTDLHKHDAYCGPRGDLPSMYHYGFTDPFEVEGKMNSGRLSFYPDGSKHLMGPYQHYLEEKGLLDTLAAHYALLNANRDQTAMGKYPPYYAAPSVLPDEDFQDAFIGRAACSWLEKVEDDLPWHYLVSFDGPHCAWDPPMGDYEAVKELDLPLPLEDDLKGKPRWVRERAAQQTGTMSREDAVMLRRCYAGSVHHIDVWVGRMLDILQARGLRRNTAVIFCADHGEMLGDHGLLCKRAMYEASVRVPLVVSLPGMSSRRDSGALAQLMDLAPTCLDLAGVHYDRSSMDARSLLPLLEGQIDDGDHNRWQISELDNCQMVYDGRFKLIRSQNDTDELYDLKDDPNELHNVIDAHPDVAARLLSYTYKD